MSNAKFNADFAKFVERANGNIELVVRKVALDLLSSLVSKSPVGDPDGWKYPNSAPPGYVGGRFKGNWFVQESTEPQERESVDKSGGKTISEGATEIARFVIGGRLFLLNHLPYSIELEYGHSKQAPQGMVRITVAEFQQYVADQAAKVRK